MNVKAAYKTTRIIHIALMVGPSLFALMVFALITLSGDIKSKIEVLDYLSPAYFFIALAIHNMVFKSSIRKNLSDDADLGKKLAAYQSASITRLALLETSAILATVIALINNEVLHLILVLLILLVMLSKFPTTFSIESEVGLSAEEKSQLNNH